MVILRITIINYTLVKLSINDKNTERITNEYVHPNDCDREKMTYALLRTLTMLCNLMNLVIFEILFIIIFARS